MIEGKFRDSGTGPLLKIIKDHSNKFLEMFEKELEAPYSAINYLIRHYYKGSKEEIRNSLKYLIGRACTQGNTKMK